MKYDQIKRAVIYARYSSDNQTDESIEAQILACEKYIAEHSMICVDIYKDKALTGTNTNRPDFKRMLEDAKRNKFDFVIVHKYDRFARNEIDHGVAEEKLNQYDVKLISVKEPIEDNPVGQLMKSIIKSMNQYYSANLSEEVMKTMVIKASRGLHLGGKAPLGYNVVGPEREKKYEINEIEANAVRLIFKMYSDGEGYSSIIDKLNQHGYRTKKGSSFKKNSISEILRNEKYTGVYLYNRREKSKRIDGKKVKTNRKLKDDDKIIRIEGGMPRIISDDLWKVVQKKLADNVRKGGQFKAVHNYLLSGKITCQYCGKKMAGSSRKAGRNKELYMTYKCNHKENGNKCTGKEINKNYLEQFVLNILLQLLFTDNNAVQIANEYNQYLRSSNQTSKAALEALENESKRLSKQIDNLLVFIMDGNTSASASEKMKELEQSKLQIQNKIMEVQSINDYRTVDQSKLITKFDYIRKNVKVLLEKDDNHELKKFINTFVESVDVNNENVAIEYNLTEAVSNKVAHVFEINAPKNVKTRPIMDVHTSGGDGEHLTYPQNICAMVGGGEPLLTYPRTIKRPASNRWS